MSGPRHIIKNQVILTAIPTPEVGIALQKQWKEIYYSRILPLIDRIFTEYSSGDEVIRIDTLDLDLGKLTPSNFKEEVEKKVETAIRKALDEKIPQVQWRQGIREKKLEAAEAREEYLFHYLKFGTLPWWAKGKKNLSPAMALNRLLAERPKELFFFLENEGKHPQVFRRLVLQIPAEKISLLLSAWAKKSVHGLDVFWSEVIGNPALRDRLASMMVLSWLTKMPWGFRKKWPGLKSFPAVRDYIQKQLSVEMQESLLQAWTGGAPERALVQKGQRLIRNFSLEEYYFGGKIEQTQFKQLKKSWIEGLGSDILLQATEGKSLNEALLLERWIQRGIVAFAETGIPEREAGVYLFLLLENLRPSVKQEISYAQQLQKAIENKYLPASGSGAKNGRERAFSLLKLSPIPKKEHADEKIPLAPKSKSKAEGLSDPKQEGAEERGEGASVSPEKENLSPSVPLTPEQLSFDESIQDASRQEKESESKKETPSKKKPKQLDAKDEVELRRLARDLKQHDVNQGKAREQKAMDFIRRMQELAKKQAGKAPTSNPYRRDKGEEFFVENAGMVLLWPFLSRYFDYAGLLKNGDFVDDLARERAVHLLQYLVSGQDAPEVEYNLVLNKIFCGIQPETPIGTDVTLTDKEKEQGDQVLHALIGYWDKLKSTSIDGLRGTFLLREGSIRSKDGGWVVKIARKPYDILIDYLPFGIGTIKLSYLDEMIFTEW